MTIKVNFEVTDTFGGETNYTWVKRGSVEFEKQPTSRQMVLALKKFAGLTNVRCNTIDHGDVVEIHPVNQCIVAFAVMEY
jgi:hypothetical protein